MLLEVNLKLKLRALRGEKQREMQGELPSGQSWQADTGPWQARALFSSLWIR